MKLIEIDKNVQCWAPRGQIIAILYKDRAISILPGFLPNIFNSFIYLQIKCMVRRKTGSDYEYAGYGIRLLPSLTPSVCQWPKWYQILWRAFSWRNYDVCGVLNSGAENP